MSGGKEFIDAALWRRWREEADPVGEPEAEPDALALAAYADRRLGRPGADPETDPAIAGVEAWLALHPDAFDDILAARSMVGGAAPADLIDRAQALIARPEANIVALRPAGDGWRRAVAWSGIAASMIAAVLVGFTLGTSDVIGTADTAQNQGLEQALIGSPTATILSPDDEENGT